MNKKWLLVKNKDETSVLYTVKTKNEQNDIQVKLFYSILDKSISHQWRGKLLGKCQDNGNNITFTFKNKSITLNYCEIEEMELILNEWKKLFISNNFANKNKYLKWMQLKKFNSV